MSKNREFLSSDEACAIYSALRVAAKQYETDAEAMRQAQQLGLAEVFAAQVARSLDLANRIEDAAEVILESEPEAVCTAEDEGPAATFGCPHRNTVQDGHGGAYCRNCGETVA